MKRYQKGDKLGDILKFHEGMGLRRLDTDGLFKALKRNKKVWSWGTQAWKRHPENWWIRFKANAHHHKGHVYILCNGTDELIVMLTTTRRTVQRVIEPIFIGDLVETIDNEIEMVEEYKW